MYRWTEYCKYLYIFKINPYCDTLHNDNHPSEMEQPPNSEVNTYTKIQRQTMQYNV